MKRFTTESDAGRARARSYGADTGMEAEPATPGPANGAQKVDPSVTLGPLGTETRGAVPIKSPAYTGKF